MFVCLSVVSVSVCHAQIADHQQYRKVRSYFWTFCISKSMKTSQKRMFFKDRSRSDIIELASIQSSRKYRTVFIVWARSRSLEHVSKWINLELVYTNGPSGHPVLRVFSSNWLVFVPHKFRNNEQIPLRPKTTGNVLNPLQFTSEKNNKIHKYFATFVVSLCQFPPAIRAV